MKIAVGKGLLRIGRRESIGLIRRICGLAEFGECLRVHSPGGLRTGHSELGKLSCDGGRFFHRASPSSKKVGVKCSDGFLILSGINSSSMKIMYALKQS